MAERILPESVHPRALEHIDSVFREIIRDESELTAGTRIEAGKRYGFFTDTSLCIGCKACEVACKEWNLLPADNIGLTGMSYDNTGSLSATTWRHVGFVEKIGRNGERPDRMGEYQSDWLMMSDVCKHCWNAGCLEACPTGAIFRTEFGTVVVQQDICNGCGYCIPSCPFGVIEVSTVDGKAHKCTLCYDRMKGGLEPACAKTCPTDSIRFGEIDNLKEQARDRLEQLRAAGRKDAILYGVPGTQGATGGIEELQAFFLLLDDPEVYNLPHHPQLPSVRIAKGMGSGMLSWGFLGTCALILAWLGSKKSKGEKR
jgi:formate dehydrogenase iron-sulfur subunit